MVDVLYWIERPFMRKTFDAIDHHLDWKSAYLPTRAKAAGCSDVLDAVTADRHNIV